MRRGVWMLMWVVVILASCNTGSRFASSFGKRKYTKGYFVDNPASIKASDVQATITQPLAYTKPQSTIACSVDRTPVITENTKASPSSAISKSNNVRPRNAAISLGPNRASAKTEAIAATNKVENITAEKSSSDNNYLGIIGCALAIIGIILAFISAGPAGTVSVFAFVVMAIGDAVSIYSLFLNKIYLNWVPAIGICLTILLVALLLL